MTEPQPNKMQVAHLIVNDSAQTLVATVEVPAFPYSPALVEVEGRFFTGPNIGYGVPYLTYLEVALYTPLVRPAVGGDSSTTEGNGL